MIILLTNDDGIDAKGLLALEEALADLGTIYVVAPDREQSASSHSLTLHRPLRARAAGERRYAVDGTPTDCVYLAVNALLPSRPVLLVSGINQGSNLGDDVTYSGTVAGAMEGTLFRVSSVAMSLVSDEAVDFSAAAEFSHRLAAAVLRHGLPRDTLLNVNVPASARVEDLQYRFTVQGKRMYNSTIIQGRDPRGKVYYWVGGELSNEEIPQGTDVDAVQRGFISITPIHMDLTNHAAMGELSAWSIA